MRNLLTFYMNSPAVSPVETVYDTDALAYLTAAAIDDTAQRVAINNFFLALKAGGIYSRTLAMYLFLGGDATTRGLNAKDPRDLDAAYRLSFAGGWTHGVTGSTPNGTTGYADTHIDLHQKVPSYSFYGAHYSRTPTIAGASDYYLFGIGSLGLDAYNNSRFYSQMPAKSISLTGITDFSGLYSMSAYNFDKHNIYHNGVSIGSNTAQDYGNMPSLDPDNPRTLYVSALNNNGTATYFSAAEVAFASFGLGISSSQMASLNTAVTNLLTALNRNI